MKYKYLIWDWNGTILDDAELCVECMNLVLGRRNMPLITLEKYAMLFDFPVINYYLALGFDFDEEPFEISGTEFIAEYDRTSPGAPLMPGIPEVLQELQELGCRHTILSAQKQEALERMVEAKGIAHHFSRIVGAVDHYAFGKREKGRELISALDVSPEEVLLVGDTLHDADVAKALNIDCVLIPGGHQARERLGSADRPLLDSCRHLLDWMKPQV